MGTAQHLMEHIQTTRVGLQGWAYKRILVGKGAIMAKTSAGDLRAIRAWQAANPDKVRAAQHRYEVAHYAERKAAKREWARRNRLRYVNGVGRAAGFRMKLEQDRKMRQGKKG